MNAPDSFGFSLSPGWTAALLMACLAGTALLGDYIRRQRLLLGSAAFEGATVLRLDTLAIGMGWLAFAAASALGGPMPLQLAGVTCALCACFAAGKPPWTTLGLHRWNWRGVGMVPATYMALLLPLNGLLWVSYLLCSAFDIPFESQPIVEQFAQMKSFRDIATFVFMATVIAPVCEELFFRGFLHGWFCAWMPRPVSWVVTSALFAAAHWHFPTFLPLFLLGGVLVLLYEITGSLWTSVLLHTLFNSITLVVALRFAPPTH